MAIIDKLKRLFTGKKSFSPIEVAYGGNRYFFNLLGYEGYSYNDANFNEYAFKGFKNPYVYSVVSKISRTYSQLPHMWADDLEGKQEANEATLRQLADIDKKLNKPYFNQNRYDFLELVAAQYLIHGNAIIYPKYPVGFENDPKAASLCVARLQDVTIETVDGSFTSRPKSYRFRDDARVYDASEVLHITMPNALKNEYWGLSPLYAGQAVYTSSNNIYSAQASIHENRGVSGVLSPKDSNLPMGDEQQKSIQESWQKRTAGTSKFGGVHVTNMAMTYTPIGMNATDLKLIESNLEALRDACRLYGINSVLFNDHVSSTYNNVLQAQVSFYKDVLAPLAVKLSYSIGEYLLKMFNLSIDAFFTINKKSIEFLNRPNQELSTKIIQEVAAGIITVNEAREELYPHLGDIENIIQDENEG